MQPGPGSGCKQHLKIKGNRNYYFKTIRYCSRTKVKSSLILRGFYATGPDYMSWAQGSFCRDLGTFVKRKNNQLCDYMTTERARPVGRDPSIVMQRSCWKFSKLSCLPGGPVNEPIEKQDNG